MVRYFIIETLVFNSANVAGIKRNSYQIPEIFLLFRDFSVACLFLYLHPHPHLRFPFVYSRKINTFAQNKKYQHYELYFQSGHRYIL
jgi:hypothetical protein